MCVVLSYTHSRLNRSCAVHNRVSGGPFAHQLGECTPSVSVVALLGCEESSTNLVWDMHTGEDVERHEPAWQISSPDSTLLTQVTGALLALDLRRGMDMHTEKCSACQAMDSTRRAIDPVLTKQYSHLLNDGPVR